VLVFDNRSYGNIWYRAHEMGTGPEELTDIPGIDWPSFARPVEAEGSILQKSRPLGESVGKTRLPLPVIKGQTAEPCFPLDVKLSVVPDDAGIDTATFHSEAFVGPFPLYGHNLGCCRGSEVAQSAARSLQVKRTAARGQLQLQFFR